MSETVAQQGSDGAVQTDPRERAALIAFVSVAIVATVSWLVLLAWLVLVGLRALGV